MKIVPFILSIAFSLANICYQDQLAYSFSDCTNNERSIIFYWKSKDCSNKPPEPIEHISCEIICEPGTHLTFNMQSNKVDCTTCPRNTYSTGSTLQFSSLNWNEFLQIAISQCAWVESKIFPLM